mmetsp:Transcript_5883/g.9117  ORF Transcript_5883/g.9117 Transcript_5883/m.9117 type:complete len:258 (-) Transcript_5883:114-887(-)
MLIRPLQTTDCPLSSKAVWGLRPIQIHVHWYHQTFFRARMCEHTTLKPTLGLMWTSFPCLMVSKYTSTPTPNLGKRNRKNNVDLPFRSLLTVRVSVIILMICQMKCLIQTVNCLNSPLPNVVPSSVFKVILYNDQFGFYVLSSPNLSKPMIRKWLKHFYPMSAIIIPMVLGEQRGFDTVTIRVYITNLASGKSSIFVSLKTTPGSQFHIIWENMMFWHFNSRYHLPNNSLSIRSLILKILISKPSGVLFNPCKSLLL